ncbi:MAG: TonB-dependent receptor [Acidobacteria bacterium]|nr:TonB-dependent receptor [Acidobacteriota bacterium]
MWRIHLLAAVSLFLLVAAPALAQNVGTVRGEVRDTNGDPLPGVLVRVTGDLVRGDRSTTTGTTGEYLVTALPPGLVTVTGSLEGFLDETVDDVRVSISATSTVNLALRLVAGEETITVTSERPILDVTSNVISTNLSEEFIDPLPTNRNFQDYAGFAKGMSNMGRDQTYAEYRYSAYGGGMAANSWNVDGLNASLHENSNVWWWINPDTIAEVQVLGVAAPAEYGGMSGAAINVVTKSGTNEVNGRLNYFGQYSGTTAEGPRVAGLSGEETGFYRDSFQNYTLALGGPFQRDRLWYFASLEYKEDALGEPGQVRELIRPDKWERYNLKLDWLLNTSNTLTLSGQYEDYDWQQNADPFTDDDATSHEFGKKPGWKLGWQSVFTDRTFFEVSVGAWDNYDRVASVTGSIAPPVVDYTAPVPTTVGGVKYPYDYPPEMSRASAKLTRFADDLGGSHEFKFGIQYTDAGIKTAAIYPGASGKYYYKYNFYGAPYYFIYSRRPHYYGSDATGLGLFADDSWSLSDRVTLNLGVRYDQDNGDIPAFPELSQHFGGENQGVKTGTVHPAYRDVVDWQTISPRIGLAYQVGEGSRQGVFRASYGKYFENNNTAMWNGPHPNRPAARFGFSANRYGPFTYFRVVTDEHLDRPDPNMKPPEFDQYAVGYEQQLSDSLTIGAEVVIKRGENLIGWHILDDGVYEEVPFVNPETGETMTLFSIIEEPTRRKGNSPGPGANAPPGARYYQDYEGFFVTLRKRQVGRWGLNTSLGYSKSSGRNSRPLNQIQGQPFFGNPEGTDPNHHLNGDGLYQADRKLIFLAQGQVELPWNLRAVGVVRIQDGRPYTVHTRVRLNQGLTEIALHPHEDDVRLPSNTLLDLGLGRSFSFANGRALGIDLQVQNALNDDGWDQWQVPGYRNGNLVPLNFLLPRRLTLRLTLDF